MVNTLTTSGAVAIKAGKNYSSDFNETGDIKWNKAINDAEASLMAAVRIDLVTNYAGYDGEQKLVFDDWTSSKAALTVINYDMGGYTSRAEAQTMLDVNYTIMTDAMKLLKEKFTTDFVTG